MILSVKSSCYALFLLILKSAEQLEILISKGYNRTKFVRLAVEEKLYRDYRSILKQIEKENNKEFIPF